jgi:hypothetical protein
MKNNAKQNSSSVKKIVLQQFLLKSWQACSGVLRIHSRFQATKLQRDMIEAIPC